MSEDVNGRGPVRLPDRLTDASPTGVMNPATRSAHSLAGKMLFLDAVDPDAPIVMYINSGGGAVTAGLAIYDMMMHVRPPVYTVRTGNAIGRADRSSVERSFCSRDPGRGLERRFVTACICYEGAFRRQS